MPKVLRNFDVANVYQGFSLTNHLPKASMRMSSQSIRWRTLWASVSTLDSSDEDVPPEADKLNDLENKKGMLDSMSSNSVCESDHRPNFSNGLLTIRGECPETAGCHHEPLNEHSDSAIMCDGKRKLVKEELGDPEDVLSGVADVLLTRVLSFLPTKTAIRTSVLSTRWNPLWATVPRLELSISDFLPRGMDLYSQLRRKANFLAFVQRFLRRNSPCYIESLNLHCSAGELSPMGVSDVVLVWCHDYKNHPLYPEETSRIYWYDLESWTRLAEGFKVPRLTISCDEDMPQFRQLRPNFFRFENLVVLELGGYLIFNIPVALVCFPKLKVLRLEDIRFKDNYSASNLINYCCPVLEELFVSSADGENVFRPLVITAKTLTQLELEFIPEEEDVDEEEEEDDDDDNHDNHDDNHDVGDVDSIITVSGTRIDVPALQYLRLQNVLITYNDVAEVLGALDEANLDVSSEDDLFWLLVRICNVKILSLSEATLMSIHSCRLPIFYNLTCLEIEQSDAHIVRWETLVKVLKNVPRLEYLYFEGILFEAESVHDWFDCKTEPDVPICLTKCLKTVEIGCTHGDEDELKIVEYFIKHSQVLQKMEVVIKKNCSGKGKIKKGILKLPKGSPECDVVVMYTT